MIFNANYNTITDNEIIGDIYLSESDYNDISYNYIHSPQGNGIKLYYPVVESVRSILPIVDEFVIAVGNGDPA